MRWNHYGYRSKNKQENSNTDLEMSLEKQFQLQTLNHLSKSQTEINSENNNSPIQNQHSNQFQFQNYFSPSFIDPFSTTIDQHVDQTNSHSFPQPNNSLNNNNIENQLYQSWKPQLSLQQQHQHDQVTPLPLSSHQQPIIPSSSSPINYIQKNHCNSDILFPYVSTSANSHIDYNENHNLDTNENSINDDHHHDHQKQLIGFNNSTQFDQSYLFNPNFAFQSNYDSQNYVQYEVRKFTEINPNNQSINNNLIDNNNNNNDDDDGDDKNKNNKSKATHMGKKKIKSDETFFHLRVSTTHIKNFTTFADEMCLTLFKNHKNISLPNIIRFIYYNNLPDKILGSKTFSNNLLYFKSFDLIDNTSTTSSKYSKDSSLPLLNNYILAILLNKQLRRYLRKNLKPKKGTNIHDGYPVAIQNSNVYRNLLHELADFKIDFVFTFTLIVKEYNGISLLYFALNELPDSLKYKPEFLILGGIYNSLNPTMDNKQFLSHLSTYVDMLRKKIVSMIINKHEYSIKVRLLYFMVENKIDHAHSIFQNFKQFNSEKNLLFDNNETIFNKIFFNGILVPFNRIILNFFDSNCLKKIALNLDDIGNEVGLPFSLSLLISNNFNQLNINNDQLQLIQSIFPLMLNIFQNQMFTTKTPVSNLKFEKLFTFLELLVEYNSYISIFFRQYVDLFDMELLVDGMNKLNFDLMHVIKDEQFIDVVEPLKMSLSYTINLFSKWEQDGCLNVLSFDKLRNSTDPISEILNSEEEVFSNHNDNGTDGVDTIHERINLINVVNYLKMYNLDSLEYMDIQLKETKKVSMDDLNVKLFKKVEEFIFKNSITSSNELIIENVESFTTRSTIIIPKRTNDINNFVRIKFPTSWKYVHIYSMIMLRYQIEKIEKIQLLIEFKENRLDTKFRKNNNNRPSFSIGSYISLEHSNRETKCVWLEDNEIVGLKVSQNYHYIIDSYPIIKDTFLLNT